MFKHLPVLFVLIALISVSVQGQDIPKIYQTFITDDFNPNNGGYISIINALTLQESEKIDLPTSAFQEIKITSDKKKAFINNSPRITPKQGITIVDLEEKHVIKKMFEGISVYAIEIAPDEKIWVLLNETQEIAIIDPLTLNVNQTFKLSEAEPARDLIFSSDGKQAYISMLNKDIFILDVQKKTTIRGNKNLPQRDTEQPRPQELELSPDGNLLFVSSKDTVSILNSQTLILIDSFTVNKTGRGDLLLKITHDGRFLYVVGYLGSFLFRYDIKNKQLSNAFAPPGGLGVISNIDISKDNKILYVNRDYGISLVDIGTQTFIANIQISTGAKSGSPFSSGFALTGNFSIGENPSVKTSSPSANDTFVSGQEVKIKWQTTIAQQSYSLASHRVELSTDGGQTFSAITGAEQLPPTAQEFSWTVPNIEVTNKAQIRVSTVDLGARRASDNTGNFSIIKMVTGDSQVPTVSFLSPKGNEQFTAGDMLQINWMSSDNVGVTSQDLSLSIDGGTTFPITIASGLTGITQSFSFPIPETLSSNQTRLRLVVKDAAGNMAQTVTPANFTIKESVDSTAPTVTISSPSNNSSLMAGQSIQVNWKSTDNRAVVSQALLISFDGGQNFMTAASFGATDNSFVISNIDKLNFTTSQTIIRITAKDSAGNVGQASTQFIIKPMISVANYQAKVLTINGIGFMSNTTSNSNSNIQVLLNNKVISVAPKTLENMSIIIKGNKKKLNLVKGSNNVQLMVDGVLSNQMAFQF